MGQLILENAVQALNDGGIPARRGYPAGQSFRPEDAAAAVNLAGADLRNQTVTVTVRILSPGELGGAYCEDKAMEAGEILRALGGKCSLEECGMDGRTGLFCQKITAQFASQTPNVTINETQCAHAVAFTSWRQLDDEVADWNSAKWQFRLEEYVPMGESEEEEPLGSFLLTHTCENGTEAYSGCTWTYQRRVWDATGVRQIRLGIAESFDVG